MKIAFLVSEVAPYAKTGGLADVAGALPPYLSRAGLDVAVFAPFYREVKRKGLTLVKAADGLSLPWKGGIERFNVWADPVPDYPVCFIEHDGYFDREGLYGDAQGDYPDNGERFAFFCRAVLEALKALPFEADIIHVNDWQTAPALAYLTQTALADDPFYARMRSVCTIHNLAYQGLFPPALLETIGLPDRLCRFEALEFWGRVNFLKAGILYADRRDHGQPPLQPGNPNPRVRLRPGRPAAPAGGRPQRHPQRSRLRRLGSGRRSAASGPLHGRRHLRQGRLQTRASERIRPAPPPQGPAPARAGHPAGRAERPGHPDRGAGRDFRPGRGDRRARTRRCGPAERPGDRPRAVFPPSSASRSVSTRIWPIASTPGATCSWCRRVSSPAA